MFSANGREVARSNVKSEINRPCDSVISELRGLVSFKVTRNYPRGAILFADGQRSHGLHVLCEGRAKVSIASEDGKTLLLRIAQPGELLGLNAVLTGKNYSTTVETIEPARVDFIARADLMRLLERDRQFSVNLAQALSHEMGSLVEHARLLLLSQSAPHKLARLLLRWCEDHGKRTANGTRIDAGLTHEEIGQLICSSRETVTRAFAEFKRKHLISLAGSSIFINRKALEGMVRGLETKAV